MKVLLRIAAVGLIAFSGGVACSAAEALPPAAPPKMPSDVKGRDGVKSYLLAVCASSVTATHDFRKAAGEYQKLASAHGGAVGAAEAEPAKVAELILAMRNAYQRIDSYGYEYMEGIVAGVPSLIKYDIELDSGVPAKQAASVQDTVAPVVIQAGALKLDREGSLNNFLIEPTVYGTNPRFVAGKAKLPGFDAPVNLPNPELAVALADYAVDGYARLQRDASAWQPTDADCYHAIYNMTPTLADYFDEWKESKKYGSAIGGRFVAVPRVSDMRGIMSSVQLTWEGVAPQIRAKDPSLADNITQGYVRILKFIDTIDAGDHKKSLNVETIDALGSQAKERADKLTVQTAQAASLAGIEVNNR